jgi:hypothetical protein
MKGKLNKRDNDYWLYNEYGETIASSWGVDGKKLSYQNCNEIFGIVDVEKLAMGYDLYEKINFVGQTRAYITGFNKAMELNKDKVFTLEDMKKACSLIFLALGDGGNITTDEVIQSLQQPTEIEVEIETETKVWEFISNGEFESFEIIPKLDKNGCLILKKL